MVLHNPLALVSRLETNLADPYSTLEGLEQPTFAPVQPQVLLTICQNAHGEVACRLDMNHALNDGDSSAVVTDDFIASYQGLSLPPAPQFRELMEHLQCTSFAAREQYWAETLKGAQSCRFPVAGDPDTSSQSSHVSIQLDRELTARIYSFCRARDMTRSVFIQVVWAMSLYWYTGMTDVCFGYMASGRDASISSIESMFAAGLGAKLTKTGTDIVLSYRTDMISDSTAEVADTVNMAMAYVLDCDSLTKTPLSSGFFKYIVSESETDTVTLWKQYFHGLETQHFPALPNPAYSPRTTGTIRYQVDISTLSDPRAVTSASIYASLAILHGSYTNTTDVVLGIRNGCSSWTVPLRVRIDGDCTLDVLLQHVEHDITLVKKFGKVGIQHVWRVSEESEQGCQFRTLLAQVPNGKTTLDPPGQPGLVFWWCFSENPMDLDVRFDSSLPTEQYVRCMLRQFEHLLGQLHAGDNRDLKLMDLPLATREDLTAVWTWNGPAFESIEACMHDQIAAMARIQPDAPTVCAWDGDWTYQQVDDLSTRLASRLVPYLTQGTTVPLFFEKSAWAPIAMIAVIKAGGCSLALDTAHPPGRLAALVEQVQPVCTLGSASNADLAREVANVPVIVVDRPDHDATNAVGGLPAVMSSDPLYVIFTPGSTGQPKGYIVSHSNFASAVHHQRETWQFGPGSRVLDAPPYAFDVAWGNPLHTLSSGGCLCIPNTAAAKEDMVGILKAYRATHAEMTPSLARTLDPAELPDLRCFSSSGEALDDSVLRRWSSVERILNAYGPAECTAVSTIARVGTGAVSANIGRGLSVNTWVVSPRNGQVLAPMYGIGELWLEGPLVGQGYLNDSARTAEAFIDDALWLLEMGRHGRLYRTGDLVRYDPDGSLVFVGCKDNQVKIRGQRVELGEVEHHA
ncbi:hypothetical protein BDW74DRAFT_171947 [Aspergillus multicolor]|uniref:uncharacterized protein n=1 Tax=Aspergillus multicolor TaxID=41759 RepID=UPI003CCD067A